MVVIPVSVAGTLSYTFPCLCAKPSYVGLASLPQCPVPLGLIAIPVLQYCDQGVPLDTWLPHEPADVLSCSARDKICG